MQKIIDALLDAGWIKDKNDRRLVNPARTVILSLDTNTFYTITEAKFGLIEINGEYYRGTGTIPLPSPRTEIEIKPEQKLLVFKGVWAFYYGSS